MMKSKLEKLGSWLRHRAAHGSGADNITAGRMRVCSASSLRILVGICLCATLVVASDQSADAQTYDRPNNQFYNPDYFDDPELTRPIRVLVSLRAGSRIR